MERRKIKEEKERMEMLAAKVKCRLSFWGKRRRRGCRCPRDRHPLNMDTQIN